MKIRNLFVMNLAGDTPTAFFDSFGLMRKSRDEVDGRNSTSSSNRAYSNIYEVINCEDKGQIRARWVCIIPL